MHKKYPYQSVAQLNSDNDTIGSDDIKPSYTNLGQKIVQKQIQEARQDLSDTPPALY
jgi:hypothetical protein